MRNERSGVVGKSFIRYRLMRNDLMGQEFHVRYGSKLLVLV